MRKYPRSGKIWIGSVIACLALTACGNGELASPTALASIAVEAAPTFAHASRTDVPNGDAWNIDAADVNEDGNLDLLTTTVLPRGIVILFGQGDGTFGAGPDLQVGSSKFVRAADLDRDGHLDLVAAGDQLAILLGHGDGTFQAPTYYGAGDNPDAPELNLLGLDIADLDGDAIPDLIAANWVGSQLATLRGRGDGTFDSARMWSCGRCNAVATADFDADGDLDVATTGFAPGIDGAIYAFLNDGAGLLGEPTEFDPRGPAVAIAVGDLDGDGATDLVTGNDGSNRISVLLGGGDGTFAEAQTYTAGNTHDIAVVDLDGDGKLDVLAGSRVDSQLWLYLGTDDGDLSATVGIPLTPDVAPFFVVADLDGDGTLDLAVYYAGVRAVVSVFLGE